MTLDEAIKILRQDTEHPTAQFMPDLLKAEKLGIEALERLKEARKGGISLSPFVDLPSETKK